MIDVNETDACFRLKFVVGEPGLFVESELSNPFCYMNRYNYSIMSKYSKLIGESQTFVLSLGVTVSLGSIMGSDYPEEGLFLISAMPESINGVIIPQDQAAGYAEKYMRNNVCIIGGEKKVEEGGCTVDSITLERDQTISFNVYFDGLMWVKPTIKDTFKLRILNYLPKTDNPVTSPIIATTTPNIILIGYQPPNNVKINEIFQISVSAHLGDGKGLEKSYISANISQVVEVNTMDLASLERMINLFGNQNIGIDSLSQLYAENRVRLDQSRATAITDINGKATMNLKIIAGKSGYYTLVFQSGVIKSEPSNKFYLSNPIAQVKISNSADLKQEIEVDFDKINGEYVPTSTSLVKFPIIELVTNNTSNERVLGLGYLFEVYIVERETVETAKKAMKERGVEGKKNLTLFNIYTYSMLAKPSTSGEDIKKLWDTVSKGAQTIGILTQQNTGLFVDFETPVEIAKMVYNFSVIIYIIYSI